MALSGVFFTHALGVSKLLGHQKAIGRDAQRSVVVKASPAAALEVAQAEVLFQVLVTPGVRIVVASDFSRVIRTASDTSCTENLIHTTPLNSKSRHCSKRGIAERVHF